MKAVLSGNIAKSFIQSKLTLLLMVACLLIGAYGALFIPREEEPQIDVPTADIFLRYPGASPKEVEARVLQPLACEAASAARKQRQRPLGLWFFH